MKSDCDVCVNLSSILLQLSHMTSSGHESIGSFPSMHSLAKASPATSLIAETFTTTEQVSTIPSCYFK